MDKIHLIRAFKVALIVGIILNLINNYEIMSLLDFTLKNIGKIVFTFLVPFFVSLYSSWATAKKS